MFPLGHKIALRGGTELNLACVDFDLKNIPNEPYFMLEVERELTPELLKKLVIQQTPSGGYHYLVKTPYRVRSKVLAYTEDGKVMIEIIGDKSCFTVTPSKGYMFLQGSILDIPELTEKEWDLLLTTCSNLNRKKKPPLRIKINKPARKPDIEKPWDRYNEMADMEALVESFGFIKTGHDSKRIFYKHPNSHGKNCANLLVERKILYVFSTSIGELEPEKGYNPFALLKIKKGGFQDALHFINVQI